MSINHRYVVTGGGSGGHVTPLVAVSNALKELEPTAEITYIGERSGKFSHVPSESAAIVKTKLIMAGKLRRYYGQSKIRTLLDIRTNLLNIRDVFYTMYGFVEVFLYLLFHRPKAVFIKGGFVAVPVGYACAVLHIPYVTHDSDVLPGLANRLISRWAKWHMVALPKELYPYPHDKTMTVGLPMAKEYVLASSADKIRARAFLSLPAHAKVVLVTGGGNGAKRLNDALIASIKLFLDHTHDTIVVQIAGSAHAGAVKESYDNLSLGADRSRVLVEGLVGNMYDYYRASDVVVTRAGATTLAECAAIGRACVVVPNPELTGGHQTKNADGLLREKAIVVVTEAALKSDPSALYDAVKDLLDHPAAAKAFAKKLTDSAPANAASQIAKVLIRL